MRHVLFQAARAAACHNPDRKLDALRLMTCNKPHKLVIVAIAYGIATIANAFPKAGIAWHASPVTQIQLVAHCL